MDSQLPEPPANILGVAYCVTSIVILITIIVKLLPQGPNLDEFPTVGSNTWIGSQWTGFKYLMNAREVIQEGYEKHKSMPFKVAEPYHWTVILSNRKHLEELARASNDSFSFLESINDQFRVEYVLGPEVYHNPYHISVIRSHLTRNIKVVYPAVRDEIVTSFAEILDLRGNEWKSVPTLSAIQKVVCRTSNRIFVGLPLCRNPDWIKINIQCTVHVIKGGIIVGLFPKFLRPLAARYFTNIHQTITQSVKLLRPIIEERQRHLNEHGTDWDEKPGDLLSWLMEVAENANSQLTTERLTPHALIVNFAAIHSTSNSFTQALFHLAANPQYIQPLREEVDRIVEKDGWSNTALDKMRKVDSFLKECQRYEGANIVTLSRKALKDFTFSDGTFIPKGTSIAAAARSLHHDEHVYGNPDAFEPFRFAGLPEQDGEGLKHQLASTAIDCLIFGYGRHACPGRFFAASVLKSMLAHIVATYDVKLEENQTQPRSLHIGTSIIADPRAKVVFRNRVE